jgi:hypothetical protein
MKWAGHIIYMEEMRNAYKILVRKSEAKTPFGRSRHKWSWLDLTEIGWKGVDWIYLAQDRDQWQALVNMVLNLQVP